MKKPTLRYRSMVTVLSLIAFLQTASGCVPFSTAGAVQKGRLALIAGEPQAALGHLLPVADEDPRYRFNFALRGEGIWSYVGRAYYEARQFPAARKALVKSLAIYSDDHLARLYYGLILVRSNEARDGFMEIAHALKGSEDWLNFLERSHPSGAYWDPDRRLRKAIVENRAMVTGERAKAEEVIAANEWLGRELENEGDRARDDKIEDLYRRDSDGGVN